MKLKKKFKKHKDEETAVPSEIRPSPPEPETDTDQSEQPVMKNKKEKKEEEILRQESLKDLCAEFVEAEFSLPAIFTGDPRWRAYLAEDRMQKLALRHYMFCKAWGIEMAGKIAASIALGLGLSISFAEVSRKINAEDANLPPEAGADRKPN